VASILTAVVEPIAPARLGGAFRWLFSASVVENVGDGIVLAAGPLLIASVTSDPFLVSLAVLAQLIPKLALGAVAGAVADRVDRRRIVMLVDGGRVVVFGVLAATIATGTVNITVVLLTLLILGVGETFADLATSSLLPRLVQPVDLGIANARLQSSYLLTNQLLAPPIGAVLFAIGSSLPFAANAACYALSAVLISRLRWRPGFEAGDGSTAGRSLIRDMGDGIRWIVGHPPMRTLAITIIAFNVTFGAAWSVLVLYARDRLGMDELGFGLITTAIAIGGLVGTASYGWLERVLSLGNIMRIGLVIETITHFILATTTSATLVLFTMVVFGAHAFVWNTTATTIRQRAVPDAFLGRVTGVYIVGVYGGLVIGTPIGGLLARQFGITAPFWFALAGSAILVLALWRRFDLIAHAGDATSPARAAAG
jgi:MFS family permease